MGGSPAIEILPQRLNSIANSNCAGFPHNGHWLLCATELSYEYFSANTPAIARIGEVSASDPEKLQEAIEDFEEPINL